LDARIFSKGNICHDDLITISMHYAEKSATRTFFDEALKIDPGSVGVWVSYMWSFLPMRGGSHEEMLQLADESDKYLSFDSWLKVLHGYSV
jgi:hypothetical protein